MGYVVRETSLKRGTRVEVLWTYVDAKGIQRERQAERIGLAKTDVELDTMRAQAEKWILEHELPAPAPLPHDNLIDLVATARQREDPRHLDRNDTGSIYDWRIPHNLPLGAHDVVSSYFRQHDLDSVLDARDPLVATMLRDEAARQTLEIGRSELYLERHRPRTTFGRRFRQARADMLRLLTVESVKRLHTLIAEAAKRTLGATPTEACLLVNTQQCLITNDEYKLWRQESDSAEEAVAPLRPRRVTLAVLLTPCGLPIDCWTTTEPMHSLKALRPLLSAVRRRHPGLRIALAAGETMLNAETLPHVARAGFGHIIAADLRALPPPLTEKLAALSVSGPPHGTREHQLEDAHDGRRLIAHRTYNRKLSDERRRARRFADAEDMMDTGRFRANPYISIDPEHGAQLRPDLFEYDAQLDGVRAIWTDLEHTSVANVRHRSSDLRTIASNFRFEQFSRDESHDQYWTESRVAAHAALSLCAMAAMRTALHHIRQRVDCPEGVNIRELQKSLAEVSVSVVRNNLSGVHFLLPASVHDRSTHDLIYQALGLHQPNRMLHFPYRLE